MLPTLFSHRLGSLLPEPFEAVRREMDALWEKAFGDGGSWWVERTATLAPIDMYEDDKSVYLEIDLPGVSKDDFELTVHQGRLRIKGERKTPSDFKDRKFWAQERRFGHFERFLSLPEDVDPESVAAELHDGVLRITLTKVIEAQPKKIPIKTEG